MTAIYRLDFDGGGSLALEPELEYFQTHFVGQPLDATWEPPRVPIQGGSKPLRDFTCWMLGAPVLTERAKACLAPVIGPRAEFLPLIRIRRRQLFALNVLQLIDCLDRKAARLTMSPDEPSRIVNVMLFAFQQSKLPGDPVVFKVPEDTGAVFVSQSFLDAVLRHRLSGAVFIEPTASLFAASISGRSGGFKPQ
jgi:Immunity protein family (Imm11)